MILIVVVLCGCCYVLVYVGDSCVWLLCDGDCLWLI